MPVPSRGLLCDCKTSRNLRQPSFQALAREPDTEDTGGEIVIDFYRDDRSNNHISGAKQEENIIILPFFSDEELTLRKVSQNVT